MFPDHLEAATINILFVKPASSVLGINIGLCGGLGDFWEMLKENGLEGFRKLELGFASSFEKRKSRNRTHFYPIRTFKELETKQKPDILEKIVQQISRLCFKPPNWKNGLNQALACTPLIVLLLFPQMTSDFERALSMTRYCNYVNQFTSVTCIHPVATSDLK